MLIAASAMRGIITHPLGRGGGRSLHGVFYRIRWSRERTSRAHEWAVSLPAGGVLVVTPSHHLQWTASVVPDSEDAGPPALLVLEGWSPSPVHGQGSR